MVHFLMVYDRPRGELLSITPFDDSQEALRARFAEEHNHRQIPILKSSCFRESPKITCV